MSKKNNDAAKLRRRQKKLERAKGKSKEKATARRRQRERSAQQKKEIRKNVASSEAIATPVRFRELQLEGVRLEGDQLLLEGADLQLNWYSSQSERTNGENGELLSSLRIDEFEEIDFDEEAGDYAWSLILPDAKRYRCVAALAENVDPDSCYGQWLRLQESQGELDEAEAFSEVTFEFSAVFGIPNKDARRCLEAYKIVSCVDPLPKVPNVLDFLLIGDSGDSLSGLQIDRINELFVMLRIIVPRLYGRSSLLRVKERQLLAELASVESAERVAANALLPASDASREAKFILDSAEAELMRFREKEAGPLAKSEQALLQAERNFRSAEAEESRLKGVFRKATRLVMESAANRQLQPDVFERLTSEAEQANAAVERAASEIKQAERQVRRLSSEQKSLSIRLNRLVTKRETEITRHRTAFEKIADAEQPLTKAFEMCFYRREELRAEIRRAQSDSA